MSPAILSGRKRGLRFAEAPFEHESESQPQLVPWIILHPGQEDCLTVRGNPELTQFRGYPNLEGKSVRDASREAALPGAREWNVEVPA